MFRASIFIITFLTLSCGSSDKGVERYVPPSFPGGSTIDSGSATVKVDFDGYWRSDFSLVTPEMTKRFYFQVEDDNLRMIVKCQLTNSTNHIIDTDTGIITITSDEFKITRSTDPEDTDQGEDAETDSDLEDLCVAKLKNINLKFKYDSTEKVITISPKDDYPTHLYPTNETEVLGANPF